MSLDALNLLDATLDDLADLKKFEPHPAGSYRFQISWETTEEEKISVAMKLKTLEVLDVPGATEEQIAALADKTCTFWMDLMNADGSPLLFQNGEVNTMGQGRLKEVLTVLAPIFNPDGNLTNRELIAASEGAEVLATLKVKASKNDKDVKFNEIKHLALAE